MYHALTTGGASQSARFASPGTPIDRGVGVESFGGNSMANNNSFDPNPSGLIERDDNKDGIDRIGFLKCMTWAGTGAWKNLLRTGLFICSAVVIVTGMAWAQAGQLDTTFATKGLFL